MMKTICGPSYNTLMKTIACVGWLGVCALSGLAASVGFAADKRVVVSADAVPEYTQRKFGGDGPRPESYVFMEGDFHPGGMADASLQKMSFRQVVEWLAPELARKNYLPVKAINDADLLIVVSWGMTMPAVRIHDLRAQTNPFTDTSTSATTLGVAAGGPTFGGGFFSDQERQVQFDRLEQGTDFMGAAMGLAGSAQLLGYSRDLRRLGGSLFSSAAEDSLRQDLGEERYFLIIKAFDLRSLRNQGPKRSVWTLHVNMGAVGRNFSGALEKIGPVAVDYFGRATTEVTAVIPDAKDGKVDVGEVKVVSEAPELKK